VKAIVVEPGKSASVHLRDMPDPKLAPDQVAIKTLQVGLCATDADINEALLGEPPAGDELLIIGHENLGVVEEIGRTARGFRIGDLVVASVRRPCGVCANCARGDVDMCASGKYEERGIVRRHGYLAEYYVEQPRWLTKIPKRIAGVAVLLEPTSVVEKAIDEAFLVQQRLHWKPRTALILGAGPIGLLAAVILRLRGIETHVVAREPATDPRARIAQAARAVYHSVAGRTLFDLRNEMPPIDLAIEATGAASVVFDAMQLLGYNGVLVLLSVTAGATRRDEPIDAINQRLVLRNNAIVGSVNANARHFTRGVKDLVAIEKKFPGLLGRLITPMPWQQYGRWFEHRETGIKTVLNLQT